VCVGACVYVWVGVGGCVCVCVCGCACVWVWVGVCLCVCVCVGVCVWNCRKAGIAGGLSSLPNLSLEDCVLFMMRIFVINRINMAFNRKV